MKYENLMLSSLFAACLLACTSVLGSMLIGSPAPTPATATGKVASTLLASPARCALQADGVICPRQPG